MKQSKFKLFQSIVALLLCVSMFVGTTFAWFTDSVTSGNNIIKSGKLDVEMYWADGTQDPASVEWTDASIGAIFDYSLWEPGYTEVRHIKITNEGNLALQYQLQIVANGEVSKLSDVIDVYYINPAYQIADRSELSDEYKLSNLTVALSNMATSANGSLSAGEDVTLTIALKMREEAGNEYQNLSIGSNFSIVLMATQFAEESDSFGSDYDAGAAFEFPEIDLDEGVTVPVEVDEDNRLTAPVEISGTRAKAVIPSGVLLEEGVTELTLLVTSINESEANIQLGENDDLRSLDIHVDGVSPDNNVPMEIQLFNVAPTGLNEGNFNLYHVENGQTNAMVKVAENESFDAHNQYKYNPIEGTTTLNISTFSEVAMVADTENAWEGKFNYSWYTNAVAPDDGESATAYSIANADQLAAFGAIVGGMAEGIEQDSFSGKTVKLLTDINLGDDEENNNNIIIFYPIGYNSDDGEYEKNGVAVTTGFYNFCGTFDGQGHTVSNFYQNTWEMKGDNNYYDATLQYYRDGMGLFGKVYGGTIKNLSVNNFSSDGEYTTTGVIAAYADGATFENIAITNCNPRVYNIGNGGIVGCVGWYAKEEGMKTTFKNITVDNSNKISALWGSYDVACGGIVGQYYPTSGQTSADKPANGGVHFENCHISAQMDVYNDVCGNYQYYAYRYAGMLIGSVRENVTIDGHEYPKMDGITAKDCTVHFGTWNDYYYCEFEKNGHPSYSGPDDYKFSRVPNSEIDTSNGKENATCIGHNHTEVEDNQAIYLPFNNLVTGYGWGVTSKGLKDFEGVENLDITAGDHEKSVVKFEGKVTELANNKEYKLGDIFTFVAKEVELKADALTVTVTDLVDTDGTVTGEFVLDKDNWADSTITLSGTGKVQITVQDYYFCTPTTIEVTVTERKSDKKFETKFTGNFLYRVGNANTVALGSLFEEINQDTVKDDGVAVTIENVKGNAFGSYTKNAEWEKGTIQFSGTGEVKVTITDNDYCTPTELDLEVVDAVNATSATSATKNNVVLLQDCGFSSLEVSGGYTLYGNGFTMTCGSDSAALNTGYEFVAVNNGILDNVQIDCPNFDYAVLYSSNMTESGNRSETTDKTRYFNVKSAVEVNGNSQILNSRISGGRAALNVVGGNVVVENSRIELGAVASILVGSANSLTLRDVTLVQKPTASTYDSSKTLMGFSVLFICDADGNTAPVTLEGTLVQNAWVSEEEKQYVPSAGQSIISTVLGKTDYLHDIDGDGKNESLNLGFAYMPESLSSKVNTTTITDNRTNKNDVPYDYAEVSILSGKTYVYSYKNNKGTSDDIKNEGTYTPDTYGDIIAVNYSDTADGLEAGKSFGTDGWVYELNVDLDKLSGYKLDFSKLSMTVNGTAVTDFKVNGSAKPTSPVAVTAGGVTYTLTATVDDKSYTATYKVTGTETSKESPSLVAANYEAGLCVASSYGGTWHGAAPALQGIQIKYWSVAESQYKTINLADYTPTTKGKQNGTNTTWTYSPANGDFTLTLTGGQVHSGNSVYAMPVVCDGKLYFVASSSKGLVNSGNSARTIPVSYSFKDNNNGEELTFSHTWSVAENKDAQYKYDDFCKGTLTKLESSTCLAAGTMITLADGSKRAVEDLRKGDSVMSYDHLTGKVTSSDVIIVVKTAADSYYKNTFVFDDGTELVTINEHGIYDLTLRKYVNIDHGNGAEFIGHKFAAIDSNGKVSKKKLVAVETVVESGYTYDIVTDETLNYVAEDTLSVTHVLVDVINSFDFTFGMRYSKLKMKADIEKYGLYTYDEWAEHCDISVFEEYNIPVMKVGISKGLYTKDYIIGLINTYVLDESVQIIE